MGRAGGAAKLVVDGGARLRKRAPSPGSWTAAKERAFLAAIAETCNVKLAAETSGVSTSAAYVRRQKDATFRRAWDQALATGYAQLEMMMLERALHGVEKTVVVKGEATVMREYSDRVGLALLRMHRDSAGLADSEADAGEIEEAAERIVARLARMRAAEEKAAVETKGMAGAIGLIGWALRRSAPARHG